MGNCDKHQMQESGHNDTEEGSSFDKDKMLDSPDDKIESVSVLKDLPQESQEDTIPQKNEPPQRVQQKPLKTFLLQKGMKVSIGSYLYKVTASRSNGKITMKVVKKLKE